MRTFRTRSSRVFAGFICGALLFAIDCRPEPRYAALELPSGKRIKVISTTQMYFDRGRPALMLKYITDVPLTDVPSLASEADEVWVAFRPTVERAKFRSAILSASTPSSGS